MRDAPHPAFLDPAYPYNPDDDEDALPWDISGEAEEMTQEEPQDIEADDDDE